MPGYKTPFNLNADLNVKEPVKSVVEERAREYKHSIVTSQEAPIGAILAHIEGSSWVVDYYAQMKASNEEPKEYDSNQSKLNQQYHLIYNLELKSQSQDPETEDVTNRVNMNGTAVVYAGVIPNVGDVIISDIGAGKAGRSTVTRVDKKQYMMKTVYELDYTLVEIIDKEITLTHLDSYVVKKSVFNKDLITFNTDPLIIKEDYDDFLEAQDVEAELIDDFLKEFFSQELSTFAVPGYGKNKVTYDPYVVEAFREVVNVDEHPLMQRLKTVNLNELREVYSFSIWPVLLHPEVNKIRNIWKRAAPVMFNQFHVNPNMASLRYSGFYQCLSPIEDLSNVDYYQGYAQRPKQGGMITSSQITSILAGGFGTAVGEQLAQELKNQNKVCCHHLVHYHEANKQAIGTDSARYLDLVNKWVRATGHWSACSICGGCEVCCDGNCNDANNDDGCVKEDPYAYVIPSSFWEKNVLDDVFSSIIRRYLDGVRIPLNELTRYIRDRESLSPKDRFYRMMVMLIILRSALRSGH